MAPYAAFAVLAILVISVWAKGLFFNYAALLVAGLVFTCLGFLAGRLDRRGQLLLLPWGLAAVGYTVALVHAVAIGQAEQGVFLHWALVAMAAGTYVAAKAPRNGDRLLAGFGYLAAILAAAVPVAQAGWINLPGAIFAPDRWATAFQYPDTAGAVFGAGFLAMVFYRPESRWETGLKRAAAVAAGAGLILSLSRGADLVMPVGLLAGVFVIAKRGYWTQIVNELVGTGVGGLLLSLLWRGSLPGRSFAPAVFVAVAVLWAAAWMAAEWLWTRRRWTAGQSLAVALGVIVVGLIAGGYAVRHKSREPVVATSAKPYAISTTHPLVGGRVAVLVSGPATLALVAESRYDNSTLLASVKVTGSGSLKIPPLGKGNPALQVTVTPVSAPVDVERLVMRRGRRAQNLLPWFVHVLPESIYSRIVEVSGRQLSVWQRGIFVANAMTMASQRPLLGYGAAGWANDYRVFQTLPYTSREVHDGWVQWWVDGGALAGIGFGLLLCGLAYGVWRARRLPPDRRFVAAALAAAATVLITHSIVDWDLSFFWDELAVASLWTVFMALSTAPVESSGASDSRAPGHWPVWVAGVVAIAAGLFTFNLAQAQGYAQAANSQASQPYKGKDIVGFDRKLLTKVEVALRDQPNLGTAQYLQASILANLSTQKNSGVAFPEAQQAFERAIALMPTSADVRQGYANYLILAKQYPAALPQLNRAVALGPMRVSSLEPAFQGFYNVVVAGLIQSRRTLTLTGLADLNRAVALYDRKADAIPAGMIASLKMPPLSGAAQLALALHDLSTGHRSAAKTLFATVSPSAYANTGKAWLIILSLLRQPKAWPSSGQLGTVAKNLVAWGIVK